MFNHRGFTLIEMLVVTAIFSVLMVVISGLFVSALRTEKIIFASKKVLGQTSYALEYMARALRMAKKDDTGACIPSGSNYQLTANGIKFINALQGDDCQEFFLDGSQLKKATGSGIFELTSSDITISNLRFEIVGETQTDNLQPFVTVYLEANAEGTPVLEVQTSISQRNPDIR